MAAPLAIATKAIGTRVLAQAAVKTATKKITTSATDKTMQIVSKARPALDKLRAMSKQQDSNIGEEKPRRSNVQAGQDLLSETAAMKILDDLLEKFKKTRGSVNEKMEKVGLVKDILTEQTKNITLSKGINHIERDVSKSKFRNNMR